MKVARFVSESKELFYFVTGLSMMKRYCESIEDAHRIIACSGVEQSIVVV